MATSTRSKAPAKSSRSGDLPAPDQPVSSTENPAYGLAQLELDSMLKTMLRSVDDVSDLLFVVGHAPHLRAGGTLHPVKTDPPGYGLTARHLEEMFLTMTGRDARLAAEYARSGSCDFGYNIRTAHFRANYFRRNGSPALALRRLPSVVPTIASLGLPELLNRVAQEEHGLILLTAAPGQGKTASVAALVDAINGLRCVHVITLEDPIQYFHTERQALISQRELGRDFASFPTGLSEALRQAPDILAVGEIRDREMLEMVLLAVERGHLVIATVPTTHSAQALSRLSALVERHEQPLLRQRLADSLRWILSQRFIARASGGHHLIMETLGNGPRTREAILESESDQRRLTEIIQPMQSAGWVTYDQQILAAQQAGIITEETTQIHLSQKVRPNREVDHTRRETHFSNPADLSSGLRLNADSARVTRIIR